MRVKAVINAAANRNKCRVTATLTHSFYDNNETSPLTSPYFDFTPLMAPYIQFKVFLETKNKYNGTSFPYSTESGNNRTTLGSYTDYAACSANDRFNTSTSIIALGSEGWWVTFN